MNELIGFLRNLLREARKHEAWWEFKNNRWRSETTGIRRMHKRAHGRIAAPLPEPFPSGVWVKTEYGLVPVRN